MTQERRRAELPFVVGVLADLSGNAGKMLPSLEEREFVPVNPSSFDRLFRVWKPALRLEVPDVLWCKKPLAVDIAFESIEDFSSPRVAQKFWPLNGLPQVEKMLRALRERGSKKHQHHSLSMRLNLIIHRSKFQDSEVAPIPLTNEHRLP